MPDNRRFKTEAEVMEYFVDLSRVDNHSVIKKLLEEGIMIDAKLRREILTGFNYGKVTINGLVEKYTFKNLGGGVYKCKVTDSRKTN